MKIFKNKFRLFLLLVLFFSCLSSVYSQEAGYSNQSSTKDFFLLPILEVLFSRNVKWRPDWHPDIPPDAFIIPERNGWYEQIEISNGDAAFNVRYDRMGRLLEFPFFYQDSYAVKSGLFANRYP